MIDGMDPGEDIVLLCLQTVDVDPVNTQQLTSAGINVHKFKDPDEYIESVSSVDSEDTFVFTWLGLGYNYLIRILDDFKHIYGIYISEPTEEKRLLKVRGVFPDAAKLIEQVSIDARACQLNQSTHLNVSYNGETATIQNQHGNVAPSMWSQMLLQSLLRRPMPSTNSYREMLEEARHFYRNNQAQMAQIADFEKNYHPGKAINWYSRDSFVYRLVNKALRTKNLAIIYKFRVFIRDVYEQLKKLYDEQFLKEETATGQKSTITLYRAMNVPTGEANSLRSCKCGAILSINSFVSTSLESTVAMTYLGNDPERDVMLEILIDKTLLKAESSPFANIQAFSTFRDEEEVLLSMGTMLQIQSISRIPQNNHLYIHARLYHADDNVFKALEASVLESFFLNGRDEASYIGGLAYLLISTGNHEQMEQLIKLFKLDTPISDVCGLTIHLNKLVQNSDDIDQYLTLMSSIPSTMLQLFEYFERNCNACNEQRYQMSSPIDLLSIISSPEIFNVIDPVHMPNQLISLVTFLEKLLASLPVHSSHPLLLYLLLVRGLANSLQDNHADALECFETGCASISAPLIEDSSVLKQIATIETARSAAALGDHDRSLRILEDLHASGKPNRRIVVELAQHYEKIEDWSMAVVYYQTVIDECNLPPNSISIVEAYKSIASAFRKLNETELALSNYHRARQLLLQHHPPTHPLLTELHTSIELLGSMQKV